MSLIPAFAGIYQELANANKIRLPSFCPPLRAVFAKTKRENLYVANAQEFISKHCYNEV